MAYDFPTNPSENQEYTPAGGVTYIYKAPRWTLKSVPLPPAVEIADGVAPVGVPDKTLWWNSANGNLYIRYTGTWVQINTVGT